MVSPNPPRNTFATGEYTRQAGDEKARLEALHEIAVGLMPRYGPNWNAHSMVTMRRQTLSTFLHYDQLYRRIVDVPGVILNFGVQWGSSLSQLVALRGIHEPFNHSRTIVGFDTFEGFAEVDAADGGHSRKGDYATLPNYEETLEQILSLQESFSPLDHIRKFELVKGDASQTIGPWLEANPHAVVALAILDMDVYRPTRDVLEAIRPRLTKGSVVAFDEMNCPHFPGETRAADEVLGLNALALRRSPLHPFGAWAVYGD